MSDLTSRLEYIESRCNELKEKIGVENDKVIESILYYVSYLTKIVRKHLETNER